LEFPFRSSSPAYKQLTSSPSTIVVADHLIGSRVWIRNRSSLNRIKWPTIAPFPHLAGAAPPRTLSPAMLRCVSQKANTTTRFALSSRFVRA
jgi:hypothetical protein